ncbi:hypothetical protein Ancab_020677 [Ancistrocladus abbreviatus]
MHSEIRDTECGHSVDQSASSRSSMGSTVPKFLRVTKGQSEMDEAQPAAVALMICHIRAARNRRVMTQEFETPLEAIERIDIEGLVAWEVTSGGVGTMVGDIQADAVTGGEMQ